MQRSSRVKRKVYVAAAAVVVSSVGAAAPARGQSTNWNAATGEWSTPSNWTAGAPGAETFAFVTNGGTAQVTGGAAVARQLMLDSDASAVDVTGGRLDVGTLLWVQRGTFRLGGGGTAVVSNADTNISAGTFIQTGGTHFTERIYLAPGAVGPGYALAGGVVRVSGAITVQGLMRQTGGSVETTGQGKLTITGAGASYELEAGDVNVAAIEVGVAGSPAGIFTQAGGAAAVDLLTLAPQGRYNLTGGTLAAGSISQGGTFDFGATGGALSYSGIADFSKGTVLNPPRANVTGGAHSLLIVPAGADPHAFFGTFATTGHTHVAGTPLVVPGGATISGAGTIADPTTVHGTLSGAALTNGIVVAGNGLATLPRLDTNDSTSGVSSGTLVADREFIRGTFTQTGGANHGGGVFIGDGAR